MPAAPRRAVGLLLVVSAVLLVGLASAGLGGLLVGALLTGTAALLSSTPRSSAAP